MRFPVLLALALLAGCAATPPVSKEASTLGDIVGETVDARMAPVVEQRRLLALAERRHVEQSGDAATVRLAALLIALPEPLGNDARARTLLEPLATKEPGGPLTRYALLLSEQAAARERLRRDREQMCRAALQREYALKEQIEALKAIERGILEHEDRRRAKRR